MTPLAENLMTEQILYAENVAALRNGIALKFPHASSKERADLLAKAIKNILHKHLASLEETTQSILIQELLKTAIQKNDFSINAYDVVSSYSVLNTTNEDKMPKLINWLNETTGQTILPEEIGATFSALKPLCQMVPSPTLSLSEPAVCKPILTLETPSTPQLNDVLTGPTTRFPYLKTIGIISGFCIITSITFLMPNFQSRPTTPSHELVLDSATPLATDVPSSFLITEDAYLMTHLQYKTIDESALKSWLIERHSMLADEPYFSTIISAAASYNINPLLMFAITGQEQGFVPKDHKKALEIANNPFNVYGSWQDFNTDIEETSSIAARTIINLSKGCPKDADPIKWLNKKYAEDPNWHKGVTAILKQLEEIAG